MKMNIKRGIITAAAAAAILSGCSSAETIGENEDPVLLTGMSAEEVTAEILPEKKCPERVVSLSPAVTEMICEMGFGDKLAAVGEYCDYPESVTYLPKAGSAANPQAEKILGYYPDLVITESPVSKADTDALKNGGAQVMKLTAPKSLDALKEQYRLLAALWTDEPEKYAEAAMAKIYSALERAYKFNGNIMLFLSNQNAATPDTLAGDFVTRFGENAAKGYHNFSMPRDKIIMTDPDVIILSNRLDYFRFTEDFSELKAVRNNRVIIIDGKLLERPTARLAELADFISANLKTINT